MGALRRGMRNVYRNRARAILVALILGLSVGTYLTMAQVSAGIQENLRAVASEWLVLVEVRRAGATGMGEGVDALPETFFERAKTIPNVKKVEKYLLQRTVYHERAASVSMIVGMEPGSTPRLAGHGELVTFRLLDGRWLEPQDRGGPVAVVGKLFAEQKGASVGSTLTIEGKVLPVDDRPDPSERLALEDVTLRVIGIFETGFGFGDYQLFMPLDVAQDRFRRPGKVTHIFATATSVDRVERVEQNLREAFGDDADIISGKETVASWAKALQAIQANSLVAALVAVGAAALIVLFTMVLVTRERTREIGILKAIGAANGDVARQFVAESLGLALVGTFAGLAVFALGGLQIASALMTAASATLTPHTTIGGENPLATIFVKGKLSTFSLAAILGAVVVLTLVGSFASLTKALRLRPVEAIRYE